VLHSTEQRPFAAFVKTSGAEGRQILTVDRSFHYLHGRELKSNARPGKFRKLGGHGQKKGSATGSNSKPNRYRKLKPDDFADEFG